ncbi:MAG TPA: aldo/keto reductase [Acidimicrobiales bacterium]|nr:aldo/keto reductase [Acidimicrobiales bacterium]
MAPGTITIGGDLEVNRFAFGAMRITGPGIWGPPADREEAHAVLRRALELGANFIDTADAYGPDVSEDLIAEALAPYRADLVIATKGGLLRGGPNNWFPDGHPEHLREACDGSLRRLGLEQIPLYQLHRPDPAVPFADSVGTFAELKAEGKVGHVGLSNVSAEQLREAQGIVEVASVQNRYNLTDRESEGLIDACAEQGVAFIPWAPIRGADEHPVAREVAAAHGVPPIHVAIAYLLARSPAMLPIAGTGSVAHLEENFGALFLELTDDELGRLRAA